MAHRAPAALEEGEDVVRADLARARFEDYLKRRADWARRLRALLDEEDALDTLERSLIEALAPWPAVAPPETGDPKPASAAFNQVVQAHERRLIVQALEARGGVQRAAASVLGLSPTTLHEKLKRLGLRRGRPQA